MFNANSPWTDQYMHNKYELISKNYSIKVSSWPQSKYPHCAILSPTHVQPHVKVIGPFETLHSCPLTNPKGI